MRLFWVFISGWFFSSCSQGKSPQNMDISKHDGKAEDTIVKSSASKPKLGSCAFPLISDIIEGVNGTYSCNFHKKSYTFYLQNPQNKRGKLLVLLPGWNYPVMDWKYKTGWWIRHCNGDFRSFCVIWVRVFTWTLFIPKLVKIIKVLPLELGFGILFYLRYPNKLEWGI